MALYTWSQTAGSNESVEQAQSYTFKAVITIIVTGFVGAVWLGIKVMLGK
jgi:hypothetical protein